MIGHILTAYLTGFLIMLGLIEGSFKNKVVTAAIWPFWLLYCLLLD